MSARDREGAAGLPRPDPAGRGGAGGGGGAPSPRPSRRPLETAAAPPGAASEAPGVGGGRRGENRHLHSLRGGSAAALQSCLKCRCGPGCSGQSALPGFASVPWKDVQSASGSRGLS